MRITSATATPIDIRLSESVPTGSGGIADRGGLRVTITADEHTGIGETAPIPGQNGPRLEALATELSEWCASATNLTVEEALAQIDDDSRSTLARFAIHTALIDIQARSRDLSVSQSLSPGAATRVRVNALIGETSPAAVHARAKELVSQGMTALKLKVGAVDHSLDITRIVAASEAAGSSVELRLDANGAWTVEAAERIIGRVGKHRVSYIEDPTADSSEFAALAEATGVQVAIDLEPTNDPDAEIARAGVGTVVVKPAALGGIDRVISLAERHPDHRIIVSSSIDKEVGLSMAVHAASVLAPSSGPHGLATGRLIRDMDPTLLDIGGEVRVPAGPGAWNPTPLTD